MKDIRDLTIETSKVFDDIRAGTITVGQAREMNNSSNNIIKAVKVKLEYNKYMSIHEKIEFLEGN